MPSPWLTGIWKYTGTLVDILQIDPRQGGVKLYPNPTHGKLNLVTVGFEGKGIVVEVYNLMGQKVFIDNFKQSIIQSDRKLDLSSLAKGTYVVSVLCGEKRFREKIVIDLSKQDFPAIKD